MAAVAERKLSKDEFHARYEGEKPYFEYWDGEAVQKSGGTWTHGMTQKFLTRLLDDIGFESASEIDLRLHPNYELIPDVIAVEGRMEEPYPTTPFEVALEVLSPEDLFSRVVHKCRLYENWGIRQIVLIDPAERLVWRFRNRSIIETDVIASRGEIAIPAQALWDALDRKR
jgi:Uma2 family endonuclease